MDKNITIYSTPTCHFCHMAKDFLTEHNVAFTDYNVQTDLEKRQEMIEKSGQMLSPCVDVNGHMLADVSGEEVEAYLLANKLVGTTDRPADAPTNQPCAHEMPQAQTLNFRR